MPKKADTLDNEEEEKDELPAPTFPEEKIELPAALSKEITKRKKKRPARSRSPYSCRRCGKPKKGHTCDVKFTPPASVKSSSPFKFEDFEEAASPSPNTPKRASTSHLFSSPPSVKPETTKGFSLSSFDIAIAALDLLHSNLSFTLTENTILGQSESLQGLVINLDAEKQFLTEYRNNLAIDLQLQGSGSFSILAEALASPSEFTSMQ